MATLTEEDVKLRFITPAIEKSGWKKEQILMEYYFTDGQILVRGNTVKRKAGKKADYVLTNTNRNIPLAIVEAKDAEHSIGSGIQQAINYAVLLNIPFAYSTNGLGFLEHDLLRGVERELEIYEFPTENELWSKYKEVNNINTDQEELFNISDYFDAFNRKKPRYYQRNAINKTLEVIALGQKKILLVMATGTGKTFTAMQIIWKLLKTQKVKKILYLADRNILIDQTMQQDFKPFEKTMTKIQGKVLDSSYEVYMSLYHQLAGDEYTEPFREFKPEFFDLIIIDEAHRGSARDESRWRKILEYFSNAIQIGMTATPKETNEVSNYIYFGDPVYVYSLKQGIDDGFLAPYKVIRIGLDKDIEGWRPYSGQKDVYGKIIEDREYNTTDYDRNIILDNRTKAVANRITKWLKANDRFSKTIIFCVDVDHAERLRQAMVNENQDLVAENPKYIMRITGDNQEGKNQIDNFIDVNEKYPTIVTTSKLMTTGVDAKTVKLIVLDSNINSMTEFKQIIGRGTRLYPEFGKEYFTILDFREASRLFADKEFDGDPVVIKDVGDGGENWNPDEKLEQEIESISTEEPNENDIAPQEFIPPNLSEKKQKYRVSDVQVEILNERVQYYDSNGKLITESVKAYSKRSILKEYSSLEDFLRAWNSSKKRQTVIDLLKEQGVLIDALKEESGKNIDEFDLILHVAFDKKPLTRNERIENVRKKDYLSKYSEACQEVLQKILEKYADDDLDEFDDTRILENDPFNKLGGPLKIAKLFGGKEEYINAVMIMKQYIYESY